MPYGQIQVDTVKDSLNNTFAPASSVFRNRIINGAMVIDQRNAGASVTPISGTYTLDRFVCYLTQASKFTVQQNAGSVTPPTGFSNYLGVTSSSAYAVTSTDEFNINQAIEGFNFADMAWGTANAKTVTLSFQVRSSLTGTFGGSLRNSATNRSYPFSYSIPSANTWTSISITIAGDTTGTWVGATNGIGVFVTFGLGNGTTTSNTAGAWVAGNYTNATGAVSVVGTSGATFYITGVQLEVGTNATNFEYRQYGTELALCQRYAQKLLNGRTGTTSYSFTGLANTSTQVFLVSILPVSMRTNPTLTYSSLSDFGVTTQTSAGLTTAISLYGSTSLTITLNVSASASFLSGYPCFIYPINSTSYLLLSAEL